MRCHEYIWYDDKAAPWLTPKGDDGCFDLYVAERLAAGGHIGHSTFRAERERAAHDPRLSAGRLGSIPRRNNIGLCFRSSLTLYTF
jgi:hypothetical protein